jgi:hypothetical protein
MAKTKKKTTTRKPRVKKTIEATPQTLVEPQNQIKYLRDDQMTDEIRCSLMKIPKYAGLVADKDGEQKLGTYLGTKRNPHRVRGTTFNVSFNLIVDWEDYRKQGYPDIEIAKRCMNYIFTKKIKKKVKKGFEEVLPFGNVHLNPIFISFTQKNGKKYISIETTTDQKENPLLWGEGVK